MFVTTRGFSVQWQNTTSRYGYYHIVVDGYNDENNKHTQNTTAESLSTGSFSVQFNGLTPGRLYRIKVFTVLEGLMSEQAKENSSYTVPSLPNFITIQEIRSTSIVYSKRDTKDEFIEWHVKVVGNGVDNDSSYSNTTDIGSITGLLSGREYNIEFYVSVPGYTSEHTTSTKTFTVVPGVNSSTVKIINSSSNSLTITWDPPPDGDDSTYNVNFSCISPNDDRPTRQYPGKVDGTKAVVSGLDPGSNCTVYITAIIGNQTSERMGKQLSKTTDETAPGYIRAINTTNALPNSFVIFWKDPTTRNGVIRRYDLLVTSYKQDTCEPGDPDNETSIECIRRIVFTCDACAPEPNNARPIGHECAEEAQHTFVEDKTDFQYTITGLHPYMNYKVIIIPYTVVNGNESKTIQLTAEDKPAEPPQKLFVTSTTSDAIYLSWDPPSCGKRNGKITSYEIRAYYKEHLCTDRLTNAQQNQTKIAIATGNETTTKLNGLYSFWDYRIIIQASTVKGRSLWSPPIDQRTNSSVPSEVRFLKVTSVSTNSLNVVWTQPCYPNGIINKYTITTTNLDDFDDTIVPTTTNDNKTQTTISSLLPYRNYTMVIWAHVIGFQGNRSTPVKVTTAIGLPEQPTFVEAKSINSSIILVSWNVNEYTGPTTFYAQARASGVLHKQCSPEPDFKARTCNIDNLLPYKNYTISIRAETKAGISTSAERRIIQTLEAEPGYVTNLAVTTQTNVLLPRSILVQWQPPLEEHRNGKLIGYVIEAKSELSSQESDTFQRCIINETDADTHCESKKINILCQKSKTNTENWKCNLTTGVSTGTYILAVSAITAPGNGSKSYQDITVPPGAPLKPKESPSNPLVKLTTSEFGDPEYLIYVAFSKEFLCGTANGDIVEWGVVVSEESRVIDGEPFAGTTREFESHKKIYKTWSQVYGNNLGMLPYIASPAGWNPCTATRRKRSSTGGDQRPVIFIAGENRDCSESASQQTCNGKLVPGKSYRVKAFVCTNGGCTETMYSSPIYTGWTPGTGKGFLIYLAEIVTIVGAIIFVFGLFAAIVIICKRRNLLKNPVLKKDIPQYVDMLMRNDQMMVVDVFTILKDESPNRPQTFGERHRNQEKNRYANILPFDHSRVKLLPKSDEEDSDYINANYIPGYKSTCEYIATQGPIPATVNDFWRMVWEQNVDFIIMLTKEVENGQRKCERYWTPLNDQRSFGELRICVKSELDFPGFTMRTIEVNSTSGRREVRHFQYTRWSDKGCLDEPNYFLDFIRTLRGYTKFGEAHKNPIVVHCSAGVGATGTFIAVDHLLQHVREHDSVDIYKLVLEMRGHRKNMVQTKDQYLFIYKCISYVVNENESSYDKGVKEHTYINTMVEEGVRNNKTFTSSGYYDSVEM